jgi:hypothetical protein
MDICVNEMIVEQYMPNVPLFMFPNMKDNFMFIRTVFPERTDVKRNQNFEYYFRLLDETQECVIHEFDLHSFMEMTIEELNEMSEVLESTLKEGCGESAETKGYSINDLSPKNQIEKKERNRTDKNLQDYLDDMLSARFGGTFQKPKVSYVWHGNNRRTSSMRSSLMLPSKQVIEKKKGARKLLVYCDVSGSVSQESKTFVDLISKLDEDSYKISVFVFADRVSQVTCLQNFTYPYVGGGTNIESVLNHYRSHKTKEEYDAVLVLTDGDYYGIGHIDHDLYRSWYFFMSGISKNAPKNSTIINMRI